MLSHSPRCGRSAARSETGGGHLPPPAANWQLPRPPLPGPGGPFPLPTPSHHLLRASLVPASPAWPDTSNATPERRPGAATAPRTGPDVRTAHNASSHRWNLADRSPSTPDGWSVVPHQLLIPIYPPRSSGLATYTHGLSCSRIDLGGGFDRSIVRRWAVSPYKNRLSQLGPDLVVFATRTGRPPTGTHRDPRPPSRTLPDGCTLTAALSAEVPSRHRSAPGGKRLGWPPKVSRVLRVLPRLGLRRGRGRRRSVK